MAIRLLPTLLLSLLFYSPSSSAKDVDGEFIVFSVGSHGCSDYLAARRAGKASFDPYKQWLMGYLSAFNLIVVNTYDIMGKRNYRQIIRWLDAYCTKNKRETFVNASAALTVKLYPGRRNLAPNKKTEDKWNKSGNLFTGDAPAEL